MASGIVIQLSSSPHTEHPPSGTAGQFDGMVGDGGKVGGGVGGALGVGGAATGVGSITGAKFGASPTGALVGAVGFRQPQRSPKSVGKRAQSRGGISPSYPSCCHSLHEAGSDPGKEKMGSGIVMQLSVPQIEQPPAGTSGHASTSIGAGEGASTGACVGGSVSSGGAIGATIGAIIIGACEGGSVSSGAIGAAIGATETESCERRSEASQRLVTSCRCFLTSSFSHSTHAAHAAHARVHHTAHPTTTAAHTAYTFHAFRTTTTHAFHSFKIR